MAELVVPFNQLTSQQRQLVDEASTKKDWLFIEGPPGSGKTLISLHIVRTLIGKEVLQPLVLIYNNSLLGYLKASFEQLGIKDNVTINTKDKFLWALRKKYNISINWHDSYENKKAAIIKALRNMPSELLYSVIILDEIQDFTDEEWQYLKQIGKRIIVLGDFEQRVYDSNLQKSTILSYTKLRALDKIFRFGEAIASIVQQFSKSKRDLTASVNRKDTIKPLITDCSSRDDEHKQISDILRARRGDGKRIGIISIDRKRLWQIHQYFEKNGIDHFHAPDTASFVDYDFSSNTPVLITSASAKGLEFSTVIVVGFDSDCPAVIGFKKNGGFEENIYVCLSRATDYLYILRNSNSVKELAQLENASDPADDDSDDWF